MNARLFFALFLLCRIIPLHAQIGMDSIQSLLNHPQQPTDRLVAYSYLSEYYYFASKPDSALYYSKVGLDLAAKTDSAHRDSMYYEAYLPLLNNAAFISQKQGKIYEAIQLYTRSIDEIKYARPGQRDGITQLNLGILYRELGENELAEKYLRRAAEEASGKNKTVMANAQMAIAKIYVGEGRTAETIKICTEALKIYSELGNYIGCGRTYYLFGLAYLRKNNPDEAMRQFRLALGHLKKENYLSDISDVYTEMARLMENRGNDSALYYARAAYAAGRAVGFPLALRNAAELLSNQFAKRKQFDSAWQYQQVFRQMSDSLRSGDVTRLVVREQLRADMEAKLTAEKAEREKQDAITQEKLKRSSIITYASLGGVLLLLALLYIAFRSYNTKKKANLEISAQKKIVEEKNREVLDSIQYARRIQHALLPAAEKIREKFTESFILFLPRDIVSGDFFWTASSAQHGNYLAVCDSTGHGVPGAFVSLLNISYLNEAVNEKNSAAPGEVFNYVRAKLIGQLGEYDSQDGMDGILFRLHPQHPYQLEYAAANNVPLIIRDGQLIELEKDRMPIGKSHYHDQSFNTFRYTLRPGDLVIAYTDGYADQFGGANGKKFRYKALNELLIRNAALPPAEICKTLEEQFRAWKGELEQVDDVLVIGFKVS